MNSQEIDEWLASADQPSALDPEISRKIRAGILSDTKAVRPLPRTSLVAAIFLAITALVSISGGLAVGPFGFPLMSVAESIVIFGSLAAIAGFAALMAARSMRPGSGLLYTGSLAVLSVVLPEVVFLVLFNSYDVTRFVPAGFFCLGIGLAFAVPTTLLVWLLMSRGFIVARASAGAMAGLIGGIAGLGMLEVHCPLLTVPHVGVWHVAVVAVSLAVGAGIAWATGRSGAPPVSKDLLSY